jgi:hypothetical protein
MILRYASVHHYAGVGVCALSFRPGAINTVISRRVNGRVKQAGVKKEPGVIIAAFSINCANQAAVIYSAFVPPPTYF